MAKFVTPKCFLIAQTMLDVENLDTAYAHMGVNPLSYDVSDAEHLTEFAGKSCYMSFDVSLNKNLTKTGARNNFEYIQQGIIGNHHGSVLEHSSVTFYIVDVSRVVTHEIIRHRAGTAFSQTSGRYVRTDEINMYLPKDIEAEPVANGMFIGAMAKMEEWMEMLAKVTEIDKKTFAIKKKLTSAFRRLIGNGQVNNIVVTANHRAWRHMIEMRTDPSAEEEIRVVFADISRQLRARFPAIYADAEISELDGIEVTKFKHSKV